MSSKDAEPLMSPEEFKASRLGLGLSQSELAKQLRLGDDGEHRVRQWEDGEVPIPGPAEVWIRVMELRDSLHPMDFWGLKLEMVLALIDYPKDPPPSLLIKYLGLRERLRAGLPPLIVRTEEEKARLVADHARVMAELAARGYRGSIPMSPDCYPSPQSSSDDGA